MRADNPRLILEINTRVWIRNLGLGPSPSLRDIPESILDEWKRLGFDAIWLMGVWLPSAKARELALTHVGLKGEYNNVLPDLHEDDVVASPYAIRGYQINPEWGGNEALLHLKARLNSRGIRLLLDFVPNHVARDHPWIYDHPDFFVQGNGEDFQKAPHNWFFAATRDGEKIIAHGSDPYFTGWTDTAQLDYRQPELQRAQQRELLDIAALCDGVRCDMAMLILEDIFNKTWSETSSFNVHRSAFTEFWPKAISETKSLHNGFCFIAEAYWGLEPKLIEQGFDFCYDKEHLDQIVHGDPLTRAMFDMNEDTHRVRLRFLENHDEKRIAAQLDPKRNLAAATWTFALPGSGLFYDGQITGKKIRIPVQLNREPRELMDSVVRDNYEKLLSALKQLALREGTWSLLAPRTAWMGNESYRHILGMGWDYRSHGEEKSVTDLSRIFVNWSDKRAQCWVDIGLGNLAAKEVVLTDLLSDKVFIRNGVELMMRGLYLDMEPWEAHIFDCIVRANTGLTLE